MPLYTVTIVFEDRTFAVEQVEAGAPQQALKSACDKSKALAGHDSNAVSDMVERRSRVCQVGEFSGVWDWHQIPGDSGSTADVFGGIIVQTDPNAPKRHPTI